MVSLIYVCLLMKLLAQSNYHLKYDKIMVAMKRLERQGFQIHKINMILSLFI